MNSDHLIARDIFCAHYNIDISFLSSLQDSGLIEMIVMDEKDYIKKEDIPDLEKMIRLHYDLHINVEGIEVISNLLQKVDDMQKEITSLKNRIRMYEPD